MPKALLPKDDLRRLIRHRKETGAYQWDEVWNGVYVVSPLPDVEHQDLGFDLTLALKQAVGQREGIRVCPPINISDRPDHWRKNYRCPHASVFLPSNPAQNKGSHWFGGPDFAVEILSPGDRARQKRGFYAKVGVRELLLIDRKPWRLELHRRSDDGWTVAGTSDLENGAWITSDVLPLTFRLQSGQTRPAIEILRTEDQARWVI